MKLAKNQAKAKQQPEAELLLFENYSISLFTLSPTTNMKYSKKFAKNQAYLLVDEIIWLIIYNENEDENDK